MPNEVNSGWAADPDPLTAAPVSGGDGVGDRNDGVQAGIPVPPQTGHESVDEILDYLAAAQTAALEVRAQAFDETHQALQGLLDDAERRVP
jgi:hypothetical protein